MQQTVLWTTDLPMYEVKTSVHVRIRDTATTCQEAAQIMQEGGLVAFATETVYGLGASVLHEEALKKVFLVKGRPQDNPLITHVSQIDQVTQLASEVSDLARALMNHFWPGPLSILFPVRDDVSRIVTAGLDHVAIRMPNHPQALALIDALGAPIAAPSANQSGKPSPTLAHHVLDDLADKIDGVIDGGACDVGIESTVIELQGDHIIILRPGRISAEDLREFGAEVSLDPFLEHHEIPSKPRAPGQKYRHYAPQGQLTIYLGDDSQKIEERIAKEAQALAQQGFKVGALVMNSDFTPNVDALFYLGSLASFTELEKNLYVALRSCDDRHIDRILAQGTPEVGRYRAFMNRLYKAAGGNIITVS